MSHLSDAALRAVRADHVGRHGAEHFYMTDDWTPEEIEFANALERYKRINQRPWPTWSEVFAVLAGLGYRRDAADGPPTPGKLPSRIERARARGVPVAERRPRRAGP